MTDPETSAELAKYRPFVGSSRFFFDRIEEMSREDLLGLVGWLMADKDESLRQRDEHIKFLEKVAFRE